MNISKKLEQALTNQNWNLVSEVYKFLTGNTIIVSTDTQDIHVPVQNLQDKPPQDKTIDLLNEEPQDFVVQTNKTKLKTKSKRCRPTQFNTGKRQNLFVDDQRFKSDELVTNNPNLGVSKPRKFGNRSMLGIPDTGKTVHVKCFKCNGEFDVSPALSRGWSENPRENTFCCNDCCCGG